MTSPSLPKASLRRTVLFVLVPLVAVVIAGVLAELWMAQSVHADLARLFGELREVELARAIVDELQGVQAWVEALPDATEADNPLVRSDVLQHFSAAENSLGRFSRGAAEQLAHSPSVQSKVELLARDLAKLGSVLRSPAPLAASEEQLKSATYAALSVAQSVGNESRLIGVELDEQANYMASMLQVLGVASLLAVVTLGGILLRRVLRPVSELRDAAVRFGHGDQDVSLPVRRHDELGDLAAVFGQMANQIRRNRLELEERVEQRSREVLRTAKLAQLGTLAAGIAHEINNPLASIVACSDGLLRDLREGTSDTNTLREYLEIVHKEAMRTRDITNKLLRFSRDDGQKRERMWLSAQAQEVVALFDHQLAAAGVSLNMDWISAVGDSDAAILGDPAEWRQVLFNLIGNALDASPRGGVIELSGRSSGGEVEFWVCDQGPGIPESSRDQVFEPFYTTKGPGKGTGLGLSIVHRVVLAHSGRIQIASANPGTCIHVILPAAPDSHAGPPSSGQG